ncbi:unnamed protein product [Ectocarpus sp. 4 AP-2014]
MPPEWWVLPTAAARTTPTPYRAELCKQESMAFIAPSVGPGAAEAEAWRTAGHPRWVPIWSSPQQHRKQERLSCTPAHEQRTTFATKPSAKSSTMAASDQDDSIGAAGVHAPPRRRSLGSELVAPTSGADPVGQGAPSRGSKQAAASSTASEQVRTPTTYSSMREGGQGGRGGGGRGLRRRRPGEGRGRGARRGTKKGRAAFARSRDFVVKIRGMSRWNWRGVMRELEEAETVEAKFGEAEKRTTGGSDGRVSSHAYNSCLMHLAKCSRWREAMAVFERMWARGVTPNSFCLNATLEACMAAGEWKRCLGLLERAKGAGLEVNEISYNICIAACGSGKQWQKALGLLRELEAAGRAGAVVPGGRVPLRPTVGTYGATMRALGMSGKWRESMEVFRELQGLAGQASSNEREGGCVIAAPDVVTYTTLVAALGENGRTSEARQVWREMEGAGVEPNAITYHAMIAAHGNAAAAKAASSSAAASAAAASGAAAAGASAPASAPGRQRPPAAAAAPSPRTADWAEALALFDQMPRKGIRHTPTSYSTAITVAGQCRLWEEAVALLDRIRRDRRDDDDERGAQGAAAAAAEGPSGRRVAANNYVYAATITACGNSGQWEQALRLLREMSEAGVEADALTYSAAISVLAREARLPEAFRLIREMSERGLATVSGSAYDSIVGVYGKTPETAAELVTLVRGMDVPDFFAYSAAIAVCAAVAGVVPATPAAAAATAAAQPMKESNATSVDSNEAPSSLSATAAADHPSTNSARIVVPNDDIDAPRLLLEMSAAGLRPDEACFTNALSACRDRRQGKQALAILRDMEAAGVTPDGVVYTLVMAACGGAGRWRDAVSLVREMTEKGVRPNLINYSVAISACAKAGRHEPALELMAEMKDAGINPNTVT